MLPGEIGHTLSQLNGSLMEIKLRVTASVAGKSGTEAFADMMAVVVVMLLEGMVAGMAMVMTVVMEAETVTVVPLIVLMGRVAAMLWCYNRI